VAKIEIPPVEEPGMAQTTGFFHPGCGGILKASSSGIRIRAAMKTRLYTPEGDYIGDLPSR
jgi:hypothetical protein